MRTDRRPPPPLRLALLLLLLTRATACGDQGVTSPTPPGVVAGAPEAVLVGAGDIALCGSSAAEATARLLDSLPGTIITIGDHAYPSGSVADFRDCYEPTWGRHKSRTRPAPGNHEYDQPGGMPYFSYFGDRAGPSGLGYYRYRLGSWEIYSLNSNVPTDAGSPQVQWLRRELAANPSPCALAYFHHPLFSSGSHGDHTAIRPLWRALYDFDADVVISAHDHLYERFVPQDPDGRPDPMRGIRQFTVGTGGAALTSAARAHANSDVVWSVHGVLELVLRANSYTWRFLSAAGAPTDVGAGLCHESATSTDRSQREPFH